VATDSPKGLMDVDGRPPSKIELADDEAPSADISWSKIGNVGPAMIVVVLCLVATYVVPGLEFARPWKPGEPVPFWNVVGRPFEGEAEKAKAEKAEKIDKVADEVLAADEPEPPPPPTKPKAVVKVEDGDTLPAYVPQPGDDKEAVQSIELFEGDELDHFFEQLARTDASVEGAVTRVGHWGDSAIGVDGIPGAIRRRMQTRFGDAGHGFHLMEPPNTSYRHREVKFSHNDGWSHCFIIQKCRKDGYYGLGGATFRSVAGGESFFAPHPKHSSGHVSRFELFYAGQPNGGKIRLRVDKEEDIILETAADELEDRFHLVEVEDGYHRLAVRAIGGRVRLFGVVMERDGPGVVWDSYALVGAFTKRMRNFDPTHLHNQLEHRKTNLAVFTFGGNDMIRRISMEDYVAEYREVIQLFRKARPEMSCLIMSPLDHGVRKGVRIETLPVVPKMVEAQREVAKLEGCAFFDTYEAMGGEGSAGRWFRRTPRLMGGDLGHATHKGHQVIGELVQRAIVEAYVAYRRRTHGKPAAKDDK
jgi:lysophospholipase L1-like esterase